MATGHEINKKDFKVSSITTTAIENIIMHGVLSCGHAGRNLSLFQRRRFPITLSDPLLPHRIAGSDASIASG